MTPSLQAQSVTMRSQPLRITTPKGVDGSNFCTLTITVSGLVTEGTDTINLAVTGVPGSGAAAAFLSTNGLTSNLTYTATLVLTNDATIAAGEYDMAVEATGAASYRLPVPVQVAYVWNPIAGSTNWSNAANWLGGVAPGTTDLVVFRDISGTTNNTTTNAVITADATVASLRFAPEGGTNRFNTVEILDGRKLSITGAGLSFSLHRDTKGAGQRIDTYFAGGGALEVVNPDSEIGVLVDNQQNATLDMRNLNSFSADVKRIGLGNHRIWPNVYTNGYTGEGSGIQNIPWRQVPLVWLAKTNVIKCSWVDPENYANLGIRDYAVEVGNDTASGTTANLRLSLGLWNEFYIDSICWSHAGKGGSANAYNFNTTNSYALFRGIGGGRMSVWAQGDASGIASSGSNVRGNTCDFSAGVVDALIDRMTLGINRTNTTGQTIQNTLTLGGAYPGTVFDVNTAILGYQVFSNLNTGTIESKEQSGRVNVNSNATFIVNGTLHLGWTEAPMSGTPTYPEQCRGNFYVNAGGLAKVNNVLCGGVTKLSGANSITLAGGTLIISNTLADASMPLGTLAMNGDATLTLHVDGNLTDPYVHVASLTTAGANNVINIASLQNLTMPAVVPLISYSGGTHALRVTVPLGYTAALLDDAAGNISLSVSTHTPLNLVWRGTTGGWDDTSLNWLDTATMQMTNFVNGDFVTFDDTPGYLTTIPVLTPGLIPSGITVTNQALTYTLGNGGGSIVGSAVLTKLGTGTLVNDANMTASVQLNEGALTGSGTVAAVNVAAGATLDYSGTINGTVGCAGIGIVESSGWLNGPLSVSTGGAVTNYGLVDGGVTLHSESVLYNAAAATMQNMGNATMGTNAVFVNAGTLYARTLTVTSAYFEDQGTGAIYLYGDQQSGTRGLTIGAGSTFVPGGTGVGTTTVYADSSPYNYPGRVLFMAGSTNVFKVNRDPDPDANTLLLSGYMGFGANQSFRSFNGGTIVIQNVGATPFSPGDSFKMFGNSFNGGNIFDCGLNTTNSYPVMNPPTPGTGMAWDLKRLIPEGIIGVVAAPTTPTNIDLSLSYVTTISTNVPPVTNNWILSHLSWPDEYTNGWKLQVLAAVNDVGIAATNWTTVFDSIYASDIVISNLNTRNAGVYFRMVYP